MSALDATSSPRPSEIIEKTVPARRVETEPKMTAKNRPASPPTSGMTGSGMAYLLRTIAFIAWMATNPPSPK